MYGLLRSSALSKSLLALGICIAGLAMSQSAQATTIVATNFVSGGSNVTLDGTQVGLATNLPGGNWVWGAGWNWGSPLVNATWMGGRPKNSADLGEEKSALGISLASAGSYTKPTAFTVSADIEFIGGTNAAELSGLGFWSAMPPRLDSAGSFQNFTGLAVSLGGNVQLYVNGSPVGSPAATSALAVNTFYTLNYDVNTSTGAISNVVFNGAPVSGITSAAFTDAATAFAGALSGPNVPGGSTRTAFTNFSINSVVVPEPVSLGLLALCGLLIIGHRRTA